MLAAPFGEPLAERQPQSSLQALGAARWEWSSVRRVLVVRLRSIGDTVLATPALYALRRFLPAEACIDVLLEDWVAPLLDGCPDVDEVITVKRGSRASRLNVVRQLRAAKYDVAFNLHGGTTATLLTWGSGARHRVGYADYQYSRLHNHTAPIAPLLWQQERTHSVEQQLALLGWTGVPVSDRPATSLTVTAQAAASIHAKLEGLQGFQAKFIDGNQPFALIHPAAAFESKQWAANRFAQVAEHLARHHGLASVAVAAASETGVVEALCHNSRVPVATLTDLSLPEVTALAARARLFVGNDSGIAHIATAVGTPSVVVFGSSNVAHWRPWNTTSVPAVVVREEMPCAPCPGYTCKEFSSPECIRRVSVERVVAAAEQALAESS